MHQYFMSFGEYDFVAIVEMPDDQAAAAASMALGGGGCQDHQAHDRGRGDGGRWRRGDVACGAEGEVTRRRPRAPITTCHA